MENQNRDPVGRACPRGASYYRWQSGDTLTALARRTGVPDQMIRSANPGLNFSTLPAGTEICLPSQAIASAAVMAAASDAAQPDASAQQPSGRITDPGQIPVIPLPPIVGDPDIEGPASPGPSDPGQIPVIPLPPIVPPDILEPVNPGPSDPGQIPVIPLPPIVPPDILEPVNPGPSDPGQIPVIPLPPIVTEPGIEPPAYPGITCPVGYTAQNIRPGQTYADLLVDLNVSYRAMRSANPNLSPGSMVAGTPYCAPPRGARQACCCDTHLYTMLRGETLNSLAISLNTTRGRLLMLNPNLLPSDFTEGTVICIP